MICSKLAKCGRRGSKGDRCACNAAREGSAKIPLPMRIFGVDNPLLGAAGKGP
jgi:hypothetical protein